MRISELKILKGVPFSQEDKRWLTFNNRTEQYNFFASKKVAEFEHLSFVKGFLNKKIKIEADYDDLILCNYVMFCNEPYTSKWIYAWIKNFEYVSDGCLYIEIEIDYFQTYMGQIQFMPCEIEREHTQNDDITNTSLFENEDDIEITDYICVDKTDVFFTSFKILIVYKPNLILNNIIGEFNISSIITGDDSYNYRNFLSSEYSQYCNATYVANKYYSGTAFYEHSISNNADASTVLDTMWTLEMLGYSIVNVQMIPTANTDETENTVFAPQNPFFTNKTYNNLYATPYHPLNNKCFQTPFFKYSLSNLQGSYKEYDTRLFGSDQNSFNQFIYVWSKINKVEGICTPAVYGKVGTVGLKDTWDFGVALGELPQCYWSNQASNLLIETLGGVASGITSAMMGNALGTLGQAGKTLYNVLSSKDTQNRKVQGLPILQAIGIGIGWIIKEEVAVNLWHIDEIFSLKGYKVSYISSPNVLGRQRWNYVKTNNANIMGNIPIECKIKITKALNEGITFWHDKNNYDYNSNGNYGIRLYNEIINKDLTNTYRIFDED